MWSLKPRPQTSTTLAVATFTTMTQLFSWQLTYTWLSSALKALYSGSRSCAMEAPGPKMRTLASSMSEVMPVKPTWVATGAAGFVTSTSVTLPTGSMV